MIASSPLRRSPADTGRAVLRFQVCVVRRLVTRAAPAVNGQRRTHNGRRVPSHNCRMNESIERLELKLAFLERANQELSDVVYRQQQELEELRTRVALLGRVASSQ